MERIKVAKTDEERIALWATAKDLVKLDPKKWRIKFHKNDCGHAFSIQNFCFRDSFRDGLFADRKGTSCVAYGFSCRPHWNWDIVGHSYFWYPPANKEI